MLCACVAGKSRYLQPAILNDVVMFLCHFNVGSSDVVMQVCLQLMLRQINNLALDQLTTLAHCVSDLQPATQQTRLLHEAIAILCSSRGDQLALLSVEQKIYLLEEFGSRLPYTGELLESLWYDRREFHQWQTAGALFVALAKAAGATPTDSSENRRRRHEYLEEWCMDIVLRQYNWLDADNIEALLASFILLDIYDAELFRLLGDHIQACSSDWKCWLSVWTLLADADYLHIGLMNAVSAELRTASDIRQLSASTQLSVVALLAEAASYCQATSTKADPSLSHHTACLDDALLARIEELSAALQMSDNIPTGW